MRYSHDQMQDLCQQWQQSGLTRKAFCQQHNLSYATFNYWHKRLRNPEASEPAGFTELPFSTATTCSFEVIFSSGSRIVFEQAPSASWLRELLS